MEVTAKLMNANFSRLIVNKILNYKKNWNFYLNLMKNIKNY